MKEIFGKHALTLAVSLAITSSTTYAQTLDQQSNTSADDIEKISILGSSQKSWIFGNYPLPTSKNPNLWEKSNYSNKNQLYQSKKVVFDGNY